MAKIVPIHGQMSGSIAANTYSHNKGGMYVRHRSIPTNPNSIRQQSARSLLATLSAQWAGLSESQRAAWAAYAETHPVTGPLGETVLLTGHQWFVKCNATLIWAGFSTVTDPPTQNAPGPPSITSVSAYESSQSFVVVFTPTPYPTGLKLMLWSSLPQSPGTNPNERQARLIAASTEGQTSPWTVSSRFTLTEGLTCNTYICTVDTQGLTSQKVKTHVSIAGSPPP